MNEYKRGYNWYATGYLTEEPSFLASSLIGSIKRLTNANQEAHRQIWTSTALFYLGAILGQQERGTWSEVINGEEVTHPFA